MSALSLAVLRPQSGDTQVIPRQIVFADLQRVSSPEQLTPGRTLVRLTANTSSVAGHPSIGFDLWKAQLSRHPFGEGKKRNLRIVHFVDGFTVPIEEIIDLSSGGDQGRRVAIQWCITVGRMELVQ